MRRQVMLAALCALLGTLHVPRVLAQSEVESAAPNPNALAGIGGEPNAEAMDFAPIDIITLRVGLGAFASFDAERTSVDLRGSLVGVKVAALGFRGEALRFESAGRPGLKESAIRWTTLDIDAYTVGTRNIDDGLCPWWPGVLCDGTTGRAGASLSLLGIEHDMPSTRTVLRVGELDGVGSVSPAFGAAWSKYRLLGRAGASLDHVWLPGAAPNRWVGRLALGVDGAVRVGPFDVEPAVRWRPSFSGFTRDYALEAQVEITWRTHWSFFDPAGDALRLGLQVGYSYWSLPAYAYGIDASTIGKHSGFVRVVVAPSLASAVPPGG